MFSRVEIASVVAEVDETERRFHETVDGVRRTGESRPQRILRTRQFKFFRQK
jgi:hypothetical protein